MANGIIAAVIVFFMSLATAFVIGVNCDMITVARIFCGTIVACIAVYVIGFIIGYSTLSAKRLFILYGFGKNNKEA